MTHPVGPCNFHRGEPPSAVQWVWALGYWRAYWPCGCVKAMTGLPITEPPKDAHVAEPDRTRHGDGDGDPYFEAIVERYGIAALNS